MDNGVENGIKLSSLVYLFFRKLWILLLVAFITGASIFAVLYISYVPIYKSTASLYILRQEKDSEDYDYNSDFSMALSAVSDCTTMLKSRVILGEVIKENSLSYTYDELNSMVSISNPENSRYLEVTVRCDNPQKAKAIVDSICTLGETKLIGLMGFDQVNVIDYGTLPEEPCNSMFSFTIVFGAFAAFLLTYAVLTIIFISDDRIVAPDDVEKHLGLSVLAVIPNNSKAVLQNQNS